MLFFNGLLDHPVVDVADTIQTFLLLKSNHNVTAFVRCEVSIVMEGRISAKLQKGGEGRSLDIDACFLQLAIKLMSAQHMPLQLPLRS